MIVKINIPFLRNGNQMHSFSTKMSVPAERLFLKIAFLQCLHKSGYSPPSLTMQVIVMTIKDKISHTPGWWERMRLIIGHATESNIFAAYFNNL